MEQHPIPQQISSYQFKLVGDMTLKQFFQVAGGIVVSLIFYSLPLHALIKWPFILLSAGLGAAMAFLPFEERPLERWIIAFFRSIYSPTLYSWKKLDKAPVFYTETAAAPAISTLSVPTTPLSGVPTQSKDITKLEAAESTFLQKIGGLFAVSSAPSAPQTTQSLAVSPLPLATEVIPPVTNSQQPLPAQAGTATTAVTVPEPTLKPDIGVTPTIPVVIPKTTPKFVVEEEGSPIVSEPLATNPIEMNKTSEPITANIVEFSIDAAPPSPAIAPNTIVGQVMDADRKIIEGAILEIKDANGRPVRALKSNKAGHFIIVTPLQNGKYEVTIEKDGFNFDPVSFDAKGDMIPAIAIRGTRTA